MELLVGHGGFNTFAESGFRIPVLILSLHSDQKSPPTSPLSAPLTMAFGRFWGARLVEKGLAEHIEPWENSEERFEATLTKMLTNLPRLLSGNLTF